MCFIKSLCWAGLSEDTHSDTERDRETVLTSGYHPSFCGGVIPKKEKKEERKKILITIFFLFIVSEKSPNPIQQYKKAVTRAKKTCQNIDVK